MVEAVVRAIVSWSNYLSKSLLKVALDPVLLLLFSHRNMIKNMKMDGSENQQQLFKMTELVDCQSKQIKDLQEELRYGRLTRF